MARPPAKLVLLRAHADQKIIEHSQVVTTNNYNSLTGLHTLKITVTTAHKIKIFNFRFR
jgi:hypothetical protein